MDVGRDLGALQGERMLLPRGVAGLVTLASSRLDVECRPPFWRAMSSDMRESLLPSSATLNRSLAAGEGWRGPAGGGALFTLTLFSKKLRREDTGFCKARSVSRRWHVQTRPKVYSSLGGSGLTMDEPSVLSSVLEGSITRLVSQHQGLLYRCSSTVQASFPLSAADVRGKGEGSRAGALHAARRCVDGRLGGRAQARWAGYTCSERRGVCRCRCVYVCAFVCIRGGFVNAAFQRRSVVGLGMGKTVAGQGTHNKLRRGASA